jgi:preprotein translocase subunit YajC
MPMQRQKKKTAEMLKNLKSGDVVATNGGVVGTIVSVDTDTIVLRVKPDNVKLQFSRSAVNSLVLPENK